MLAVADALCFAAPLAWRAGGDRGVSADVAGVDEASQERQRVGLMERVWVAGLWGVVDAFDGEPGRGVSGAGSALTAVEIE